MSKKSAETRKRLLDAAITDIAEHGVDGAKTALIVRRAGLTTGALFGHWPTKEDFLKDVKAHAHAQCADVAELLDLKFFAIENICTFSNNPEASRAYASLHKQENA